ncbi:TetR/AcrR family transcriptional regulator [Saccharophagus degradans]|uniref:Regulatory protein, TetR n=1 Tax=Saccharophagus degradans (strain 2-40 / ATCC 43961 / DSM 17024) TaxID=203122 RepID=Q21L53_SACD2|nr:TetR/AcrR family transcriptional regulator [Saccharophagus degradans]ABD80576.1 regulatory protein, TetR [Saccharophagus degradans 2-40]
MAETNDRKADRYHHGNLKTALVDGFLEMLPSTTIESISLRKLATHIGVAATAVYNHFSNKDELCAAVKLRCLDHFAQWLESHVEKNAEPEERIYALSKAYFQYSLQHPQYFQFIFQIDIPQEYVTAELIETSMRAEQELRNSVIALLEKHQLPTTQYNEGLGAFACWSLAHGVTTLAAKHVNHAACLSGRWPPEFMLDNKESINAAFEPLSKVVIAGILAVAKK